MNSLIVARCSNNDNENDYCICVSSSKDYTSSFGGTPYEGSFTPQIHDTFNRYGAVLSVHVPAMTEIVCDYSLAR